MNISLRKIYTVLFFLGVFFIPFNSYGGISFLGEYRRDAAILFFLASILFCFLEVMLKRKIVVPIKSIYFQILLLFVMCLIFSIGVNFISVLENYYKQTSGLNRFLRQFIALLLMILVFLVCHAITIRYSVKQVLFKFRKAFLYSFIVVVFYGFFECLIVYFKILAFKDFLFLFNYFPFTDVYLDTTFGRISSVSYEPPFLAIYLITVSGWMFSYIVTEKGFSRYIPSILIMLLIFFSGSRTAFIVVSLQLSAFLWITFSVSKKFQNILQRFILINFMFFTILLSFNHSKIIPAIEKKIQTLNFKKNIDTNVSNKSRFGIQYASLLVFSENPILGVGFGQQTYHSIDRYPMWATKENYEFKESYLNQLKKSFPPGFNMYTRLLAETGLVGTMIFISFIFILIYISKKRILSQFNEQRVLSIIIYVSFVGFTINWFQFDSFRLYGFWICLSLFIYNGKYLVNE